MQTEAKVRSQPPQRRGWFDHRPLAVSALMGAGTVIYNSSRGGELSAVGALIAFELWLSLFLGWLGGIWVARRWPLHVEEKAAPIVWLGGLLMVAFALGTKKALGMVAMVGVGLPFFGLLYGLFGRSKKI
jgi:hypothetical protein